MFETFFQDLKIGFRILTKEKGFCALAVTVLALGISGVTTQFAVVNGVLLHAFDFPGADRLVDVHIVDRDNFTPDQFRSQMLMADYADIRENQQSFEYFSGYLNGSTVNLTYRGQPKRLTGGYVAEDFFHALGVNPVIGRNFVAADNQPGVTKAVMLSDSLWNSDFGADPTVIGEAVIVNGAPAEIIGVMPPKFNFPANEQLWIPLYTEFPVRPRNDTTPNFCAIMGKLKPGDIPADVRDAAIRKMVEVYFPPNTVMVTGYGFDMLYAGPREAVLHAVFRQNCGCTHLIVGRDHAGVGDYYGGFDAQTIFDEEVPDDALELEIFKADHTAYSTKLDRVIMMKDAPEGHTMDDFVLLSGTKVREMLGQGIAPPPEFSRPEVAKILSDYYQSLDA